jgi:hypothetical protein
VGLCALLLEQTYLLFSGFAIHSLSPSKLTGFRCCILVSFVLLPSQTIFFVVGSCSIPTTFSLSLSLSLCPSQTDSYCCTLIFLPLP